MRVQLEIPKLAELDAVRVQDVALVLGVRPRKVADGLGVKVGAEVRVPDAVEFVRRELGVSLQRARILVWVGARPRLIREVTDELVADELEITRNAGQSWRWQARQRFHQDVVDRWVAGDPIEQIADAVSSTPDTIRVLLSELRSQGVPVPRRKPGVRGAAEWVDGPPEPVVVPVFRGPFRGKR